MDETRIFLNISITNQYDMPENQTIEYVIVIKIANLNYLADQFLDEWIEKIEDLKMQFGGALNRNKLHGVVDFCCSDQNTLESKLLEIQQWLGSHPAQPIILCLHPWAEVYSSNFLDSTAP